MQARTRVTKQTHCVSRTVGKEAKRVFFVVFATMKRLSSALASSEGEASSSNFAAHSLAPASTLTSAKSAIWSASFSHAFNEVFLFSDAIFAIEHAMNTEVSARLSSPTKALLWALCSRRD